MERFARTTLATLSLLGGAAALAAPTDVPPLEVAPPLAPQVVSTQLGEVRRGAVAGREFMALRVERPVGPAACRSEVLRVDTHELGDAARRERIETAALSAMLEEETVVVTVPRDATRCVDGKPAFTDVRPLSPSS